MQTNPKETDEKKIRHYPQVEANPDFVKIEKEVLAYWQEHKIFERSVEQRPAALERNNNHLNNEYIFYDGPPFANGLPHYGHLLTGYVKDLFARYHTMKGKRVERRFGWDCHGLPAEMGAEKELGISGRQAISGFGIDKFNDHCRSSVMKYTGQWQDYVTRQARWVDFEHDYKTMDRDYMESVLWAFKQLYDKGLIYESYRVMPYSWAAETPLSNFEIKLDNAYRERIDKAVTVAFELENRPESAPDADKYYVLAWTTTPWTLPSNLALAVSAEMEYVAVEREQTPPHSPLGGESQSVSDSATRCGGGKGKICYIIAKASLAHYSKELGVGDNTALCTLRGEDLIDLTYKPLFPYFADHPNAFRILDGSDFIEEGEGTGIVHMAPGFGEDDQRVCAENGIEVVVPVDEKGRYTEEIFDISEPYISLKGLNVIAQTEGKSDDEPYTKEQLEKYGLANLRIINWLKITGRLIKQEDYKHNYPHCWRTDTPIIYRALSSWYVAVTKFRERAVEINRQINWIPAHIRDGAMGHMLATAPDWSISRNRFWGTPIPVWRTESGKVKVLGSITEIEEFFGVKVEDLHRPFIDSLTKEENGETWRRVEDVFDCWFESGSMPFAQVHYPFANKEWFESHFPADFITEYIGQTRGWFNTLIMLSTALFDKPPFKNCVCHGVVLDEETGLKYSKRLKNYKDPMEVFDKFGADALRWMMMSSPVMRGADIGVDPEGKFIRDVVRLYIKPIWNAYNFFCLYANADGVRASLLLPQGESDISIMDRYILAKCRAAVERIEAALDDYDTVAACRAVAEFFEVLNNWYIRRNKERFWNEGGGETDINAYNTLYTVLVTMCRAGAPLLPLVTEAIYQGLVGGERKRAGEGGSTPPAPISVHLTDFPDVSAFPQEKDLMNGMDVVRDICNAALSVRNRENIRIRQPLRQLRIIADYDRLKPVLDYQGNWASYMGIIEDEVNVKQVLFSGDDGISRYADFKLSLNNPVLAKRLPAKMKQIIPATKKGEWKQLDDGTVEVCGEKLLPEEFELKLEPKADIAGAAALSTNDALIVLDLNITPELEAEGIARDLVRLIQQARKEADLNVSDRIKLALQLPDYKLRAATEAHEEYIKEQTLTKELCYGNTADTANYVSEQKLGEHQVVIAITAL